MSLPNEPQPKKALAEDQLPPVQPPSGAFIVQLFVVPAVIVGVIALLYALFFWWGQVRGGDAEKYVEALERDTPARWQAAVSLADALRDPRNVELKHNSAIAQKLSAVLEREMQSGSTDESSLQLRIYLCHALGEFQVADGVPALLTAAKTNRSSEEKYVRFAAIKALAVFVSQPEYKDQDRDKILPLMLDVSQDSSEPLVQSTAAFALGALGGPEADARLERMLGASTNVRYNAATMLASRGKLAAVPVLKQMLDPKSPLEMGTEKEDRANAENKRITIMVSALRATRKLAAQHPDEKLDGLLAAVKQLESSQEPASVRLEAVEAANEMQKTMTKSD